MSGVVSSADATIIVALIVTVGSIVSIGYQVRVHRDNRSDHAQTAAKVDQLVIAASELGADVRDVKADVRDIRSSLRDHGSRLDQLEDHG